MKAWPAGESPLIHKPNVSALQSTTRSMRGHLKHNRAPEMALKPRYGGGKMLGRPQQVSLRRLRGRGVESGGRLLHEIAVGA
jgi:hypothetical protein